MTRIDPVSLKALPEKLQADIERNKKARNIITDFQVRVWAHRPGLASKWLALLEETGNSTLSERVRELVRLRIAAISGCQACQLARKTDDVTEEDIACLTSDDPRFTAEEQAAIRFAELFADDYFSIDDKVYDDLRKHFTTEQIVDLNMYAALMLGTGRITYVQQAYEESATSLVDA
jgi:alkylhydroperoxidase family enzyme